jgi:uncharacterized protein (TIGR02145 family)
MKKNWRLINYSLLISCVLLTLIYSCKKDDNNNQIKDIDGNVYTSVTIGTQVWMVENLKTTHLNDGTPILNPIDGVEWPSTSIAPAYCWYNNDIQNKSIYGALYNFYSVQTGKLAPKGWHVASDAEWYTLTTFLGGDAFLGGEWIAGGKMKETGTSHWTTPNTDATNTSGFTALPGGFRISNNVFQDVGDCGYWWTSTEISYEISAGRWLTYSDGTLPKLLATPSMGFSVRCIKD